MPERTEYPSGAFSWVELATPELGPARDFYTSLFGWEVKDRPDPDGSSYGFFTKGGRKVAGCFQRDGAPPSWLNHVTVEDVDLAAARVAQYGGAVLQGPLGYGEDGRMALIADPSGAALVLWQPGNHHGAEVVNEPGAFTWNDLLTRDPAGARGFFETLLGWQIEEIREGDDIVYAVIRLGDRSNGGIRPMTAGHGDTPPHWLPYFAVEDADRSAQHAEELGAALLFPPTDVPFGRAAGLLDSQGASFALFSGEFDD
jgi:uncharacterized protein